MNWYKKAQQENQKSIRSLYEQYGAEEYYKNYANQYKNPHEPIINKILKEAVEKWKLNLSNVLDLAAGRGEATLALKELGANVKGLDPYTYKEYMNRTGNEAKEMSFEDIAKGSLAKEKYSLIVCSFAMHLAEQSKLPFLLFELSRVSPDLVIITPHKRPNIKTEWGWALSGEIEIERVKARLYKSQNFGNI